MEILSKGDVGSNALGNLLTACFAAHWHIVHVSRPGLLLDFDGRCMMNMSNRQAVLVADSIFNRAGVGISEPTSKPLAFVLLGACQGLPAQFQQNHELNHELLLLNYFRDNCPVFSVGNLYTRSFRACVEMHRPEMTRFLNYSKEV
jgi:hypothetical protein